MFLLSSRQTDFHRMPLCSQKLRRRRPTSRADDLSIDDAAGFSKFAVAAGESRVRIKLNCDAAASAPRRFYVGCSIAIRAPRARCLLASRQLSFRRADLLAGESVA